jgi:hypothetical protein
MVAQPLPNQGAWIRITSRVKMTLEQPGDYLEDLISSALQQGRSGGLIRSAARLAPIGSDSKPQGSPKWLEEGMPLGQTRIVNGCLKVAA